MSMTPSCALPSPFDGEHYYKHLENKDLRTTLFQFINRIITFQESIEIGVGLLPHTTTGKRQLIDHIKNMEKEISSQIMRLDSGSNEHQESES